MKKTIVLSSASLVALTLIAATAPAFAATYGPTTAPLGDVAQSAGDVAFTPGDTSTSPVNPDPGNSGDDNSNPVTSNPTTPGDGNEPATPNNPGDGNGTTTGDVGPLTIDVVPNFDFGTHAVSSSDATYYATAQAYSTTSTTGTTTLFGPNFAQVTDTTGQNQGWTLQVSQDSAFSNGSNTLAGAQVNFAANTITSQNWNGFTPATSTATAISPTTGIVTVAQVAANTGEKTNTISFGTGAITEDLDTTTYASTGNIGYEATGGAFAGVQNFGKVADTDTNATNRVVNNAVSLYVPATASPTQGTTYTTTFTWTLSQGQTPAVN